MIENLTTMVVALAVVPLLISIGRYLIPSELQKKLERTLQLEKPPKVESYRDRLANLMASLTKASSEVDNILAELAQVAGDRHKTVLELEAQLTELEEREKQLQQRIQDLQQVPIPVAEHFAAMIAPGERRSAWRDYALFAAGVVVSTVIAILLRLAGLG